MVYEPDNKYDPAAIAIHYNKNKIGYMNKGKLRDMLNDFAADENKDFLPVSEIWDDKPIFHLFFYQKIDSLIDAIRNMSYSKEYNLVSNKSEYIQECISYCSIGDPVTVLYDSDRDKYSVSSEGVDIGYLPAAGQRFVQEHSDTKCRIISITENDNGKYDVRIIIGSNR